MTLWQSRLSAPPADALLAFTESLSFDQKLWRFDIQGSRAHVHGLTRAKLLDEEESASLLEALDSVYSELETGNFRFLPIG